MINWGKVPLASVLPFIFDSFDGGTGASITLTGLAVGDILVYKGTSMTQRSSTSGFVLLDTDGIDIDLTTGIHGFSIDTGDNTDAGFFVAGSFYTVVVASVTIDAQTVNFVAGTFWLGPTLTVAGVDEVDVTHWLGTACAAPTVNGVPEVDLTHVAGVTTNVSALATNVDAILTDTADMQPKLGTPAGASISADILVIDNFVDGLETTIGVAGAGLTSVAIGVGGIQATSFAAGAIDAAALAADATTELTAGIRIKKNTALSNFPFLMVDSIDHITPKTGLTITATRSIDGAAFAACANAATEVANGFYKINLANTDLNGDTIAFKFTGGATADDRLLTIITTV